MLIRIAAGALGLALLTSVAFAQTAPSLFKIVTVKDDVVIGVPATTVEALAKRLVADGQITVWQYAVHKSASGDLEQTPLRQIAILRHDTLRIEPYTAPLKVLPLPP